MIGVLPGLVGTLMAGETIKITCGFGEVLSGKLLTVNTLNGSMQTFVITRHADDNPDRPVGKCQEHFEPSTQRIKEIDVAQLESWLANKDEPITVSDTNSMSLISVA